MRVLLAFDSFKDTMSAAELCQTVADSLTALCGGSIDKDEGAPIFHAIPFSDGGEGFLQSYEKSLDLQRVKVNVLDPLGRPIVAEYGLKPEDHVAVIEMARASGIELVPECERNPLKTTSYGTGQLIYHALQHSDVNTVVLGIGSSATNDLGLGCLQALGWQFLAGDKILSAPITGADLSHITSMQLPEKTATFLSELIASHKTIRIACDVDNVLLGPNGAAARYGPQKGASPTDCAALDTAAAHIVSNVMKTAREVVEQPGMGAAGGIAAGLKLAHIPVALVPGSQLMWETLRCEEVLQSCQLVVSGEGRLDPTSLQGKVLTQVWKAAHRNGVPCAFICGDITPEMQEDAPWDSVIPSAEQAQERGAQHSGRMKPWKLCGLSQIVGKDQAMQHAQRSLQLSIQSCFAHWYDDLLQEHHEREMH
jgi:glycerate 2-kinase